MLPHNTQRRPITDQSGKTGQWRHPAKHTVRGSRSDIGQCKHDGLPCAMSQRGSHFRVICTGPPYLPHLFLRTPRLSIQVHCRKTDPGHFWKHSRVQRCAVSGLSREAMCKDGQRCIRILSIAALFGVHVSFQPTKAYFRDGQQASG